ncbi:MAG: hypothetical protein FWD97_09365 [Defluviitaleaceae bacterium]|nr:hypothetical protein [Defluviitaleaceae bacterium]
MKNKKSLSVFSPVFMAMLLSASVIASSNYISYDAQPTHSVIDRFLDTIVPFIFPESVMRGNAIALNQNDNTLRIVDEDVLLEIQKLNNLIPPQDTSRILEIGFVPYGVDMVDVFVQDTPYGHKATLLPLAYDEAISFIMDLPNQGEVSENMPNIDIAPHFWSMVIRNVHPDPPMWSWFGDSTRHTTLRNNSSHLSSLSHTIAKSRTGSLSGGIGASRNLISANVGFNYSQTVTNSTTVTVHNVPPNSSVVVESSFWAHRVWFDVYEVFFTLWGNNYFLL